jgi:hypothetical protein
MKARNEGSTDIYNHFHNQKEHSEDMTRLRGLHVDLDRAVATSFRWSDLDLGHDFHTTKQGVRFTISDAARRVVLDRLLALNHLRHAEEEAGNAEQVFSVSVKRRRRQSKQADKLTLDLL